MGRGLGGWMLDLGGGVNGDFGDEWMLLGWIGVLRLSVGFRGSIEILEVDGGLG